TDSVYSIRALTTSAPYAQVVVEAKSSLTPAAAQQVLLPQVRLLRRLYSQATVLVVAPWLSPRTRDVSECTAPSPSRPSTPGQIKIIDPTPGCPCYGGSLTPPSVYQLRVGLRGATRLALFGLLRL
ncbi:MAG: hypothetical protein ACRDRW_16150, partial [Pseudonocardiaceae bacterium]